LIPLPCASLLQALNKINAQISKATSLDDKLRNMILGQALVWPDWRLGLVVMAWLVRVTMENIGGFSYWCFQLCALMGVLVLTV